MSTKPKGYYSKAAKEERRAARAARRAEREAKERAKEAAKARRQAAAARFITASTSRGASLVQKMRLLQAEHEAFSAELTRSLRIKRGDDNPHLRRNRRTPSIVDMMNRDKISSVMLTAIEEICEVWDAITGSMQFGGMRTELAGKSSPGPRTLTMSNETWRKYRDHFRPWADTLSAERLTKRRASLDITIAIVVDRGTCSLVDEAFGVRKGTADYIVRRALLLYAETAGWAHLGATKEFEAAHARRAGISA